jgi:hypothetical protein
VAEKRNKPKMRPAMRPGTIKIFRFDSSQEESKSRNKTEKGGCTIIGFEQNSQHKSQNNSRW